MDRLRFLVPVLVFLIAAALPSTLVLLLLLVVLGGVGIVWLSHRALVSLCALIVLLPFQVYLLAALLSFGLPLSVTRLLTSSKELLVLALLIAALRERLDRPAPADALDKLALVALGGGLAYLVLAPILTPLAPHSFNGRLGPFRAQFGYIAAFLGARHAPFPASAYRVVGRVVMGVGVAVGVTVLWQWLDRAGFQRFSLETIELGTYQQRALGLGTTPEGFTLLRDSLAWFVNEPFRPFGVLLSPFNAADAVIIGVGLGLERLTRRRPGLLAPAVVGLGGFAIVVGQTRIELVAVAAMVVLALRARSGRRSVARFNLAVVVLVGVAVLAPTASGSRLSGEEGAKESNAGHLREITAGIDTIRANPLGLGLGTTGGDAARYATEGNTTQSGNELIRIVAQSGLILGVIVVALALGVLARLLRRVPDDPDDEAVAFRLGTGLAFAGQLTAGLTHLVWASLSASWVMWAVGGLALRRDADPSPQER